MEPAGGQLAQKEPWNRGNCRLPDTGQHFCIFERCIFSSLKPVLGRDCLLEVPLQFLNLLFSVLIIINFKMEKVKRILIGSL